MHDQRSYPCSEPDTTARQDWRFQSLVLASLFGVHPVQLTLSELIREIAVYPDNFATRDNIVRAVRDLEGVGLVHRHAFRNRDDAMVVPTRAALHFQALMEDDWR
jgi:hypothetical protein